MILPILRKRMADVEPYFQHTFHGFSDWSMGDVRFQMIVFTSDYSIWKANDVHIICQVPDATPNSIIINGITWKIGRRIGSWTGDRRTGWLITNYSCSELERFSLRELDS